VKAKESSQSCQGIFAISIHWQVDRDLAEPLNHSRRRHHHLLLLSTCINKAFLRVSFEPFWVASRPFLSEYGYSITVLP
jgi:hypothetical protein